MSDVKYNVRIFNHALAPLDNSNPSHPGRIEKYDSFEEAKVAAQKYKDEYDHVDIEYDQFVLLKYLKGEEVTV